MKEVGRERARKKEKTLTEHAAARQGLLRRARPAGRSASRLLFLSSLRPPSPLPPPSSVLAVPVFFRDSGVTLSSDTRGYTQGVVLLLCSPTRPSASPFYAQSVSVRPSRGTGGYQRKEGKSH